MWESFQAGLTISHYVSISVPWAQHCNIFGHTIVGENKGRRDWKIRVLGNWGKGVICNGFNISKGTWKYNVSVC